MLSYRLATSAAMIAALVGVLILDQKLAPWFPLWFVTSAAVMSRCALEVVRLLRAAGLRPSANTVIGGVLALVAANWGPHLIGPTMSSGIAVSHDSATAALSWPMWAFAAIVMAAFLGQGAQFQAPGGIMASVAGTVFAAAYVGLLGSFVVQMRWLEAPHEGVPAAAGLIPLALLLVVAKGSDTGAYTVGRILGRHKLWPKLSPNKTVEGAIGGLAFGVLGALLVVGLCRWWAVPMLGWGAAVGYGVLVGLAAQLGDLMESMMKRDSLRKDASKALPGFGGVLDVMDSLLFAGPVAYGYWLAFGPS